MKTTTATVVAALLLAGGLLTGCDGEEAGECPGGIVATVVQVTDGDTFMVNELGEKIRLLGIDTPETSATNASACPKPWEQMTPEEQLTYGDDCCFGIEAKTMLTYLLPPGTEICLANPEGGSLSLGVYGRYLADVYVEDSWINGKLVMSGFARANASFPHPTRSEELVQMSQLAAANATGLWGFCFQGSPEGPCE
jgi:endonuclease YncB( thermonuclease family)